MKDVFEMTEEELNEKAGVTYRYIKALHTRIKAKAMAEEAYKEAFEHAHTAITPLFQRFQSDNWEDLAQAITQELGKKG